MYISNGLRLYFKFTLVRMVRHGATPKRPTIKSPLLIYFAVSRQFKKEPSLFLTQSNKSTRLVMFIVLSEKQIVDIE